MNRRFWADPDASMIVGEFLALAPSPVDLKPAVRPEV